MPSREIQAVAPGTLTANPALALGQRERADISKLIAIPCAIGTATPGALLLTGWAVMISHVPSHSDWSVYAGAAVVFAVCLIVLLGLPVVAWDRTVATRADRACDERYLSWSHRPHAQLTTEPAAQSTFCSYLREDPDDPEWVLVSVLRCRPVDAVDERDTLNVRELGKRQRLNALDTGQIAGAYAAANQRAERLEEAARDARLALGPSGTPSKRPARAGRDRAGAGG